MDGFTLIVLMLLILAVAIIFLMRKNSKEQDRQWKKQAQERKLMAVKELDEQLELWLESLELPQLENKTKREAVARQFRTVLIEKLLLSPVPHYDPNK